MTIHTPGHPVEARLLLVEDDEVIRDMLQVSLERYGFTVYTAGDGLTGLELFREHRPDLLLLDVMLPELDGIGLCRRVRETSTVPILMMSARGDALDVVSGLESGADDYVVKPCESSVVVARIRSLLRRVSLMVQSAPVHSSSALSFPVQSLPTPPDPVYGAPSVPEQSVQPYQEVPERLLCFGDLRIDTDGLEVSRAGVPIALTPTELRLLLEFASHAGTVLDRATLLRRVWEHDWDHDTRVVDLHVQRLRAKIGSEFIETVRGFGYKMRR